MEDINSQMRAILEVILIICLIWGSSIIHALLESYHYEEPSIYPTLEEVTCTFDFSRSRGIVTSLMLRKEKKQKLNKNWQRNNHFRSSPLKPMKTYQNKRTKKQSLPLEGVLKWKRLHQKGRMKKWWRQRVNRNGEVGAKKHDKKQRRKALQGLEQENHYHRHQETEPEM